MLALVVAGQGREAGKWNGVGVGVVLVCDHVDQFSALSWTN
jgi:hypothetical protein